MLLNTSTAPNMKLVIKSFPDKIFPRHPFLTFWSISRPSPTVGTFPNSFRFTQKWSAFLYIKKSCRTTEQHYRHATYTINGLLNTTSLPAALDADDADGLSCIMAAAAADCCCCCACITSCCLAFLPLSLPAPPARSFKFLATVLTATCRQIQVFTVTRCVAGDCTGGVGPE